MQSSRTHNYVLGLATGYLVTAATVAVGFWLTPFTLRILDREQFGIFTLALDVITWLTLLDFGISSALRVQAAQISDGTNPQKLNSLASTAFFAECGVVLLALTAGATLALLFPHLFPIRPELHKETILLCLLLVLGLALSLSTQTFSALLVAHQQIHLDNAINLLNLVLRTVLTVVLLKQGWGICSLGIANLAARLVSASLAVVRTFRLLPGLQLRFKLVSWGVLKTSGGIGLWLTLGGFAGVLLNSLDRIMVGKLSAVAMVVTLTLTDRLYVLARTLIAPLTNTARPMMAQLLGQHQHAACLRVHHSLFVISTGTSIVCSAAIWSGNKQFVSWWVGDQNYGGWLLDAVLGARLFLTCWTLPHRAALVAGLYALRAHATSYFIEGIVCLAVACFLGRSYGLPGVAASFVIAALLVSCWYLPYLTGKMLKEPWVKLVRKDAGSMLLLLLLIIPVALCGRWIAETCGGLVGALFGGSFSATLGLLLLWPCLDLQSRRLVLDRILAKGFPLIGKASLARK
ncbi:MAG TPA: MATE family efflux transporter [Clostridia bacterium]|nr:MATE family efflux transporter [Clostridia bacterium]